jgi:hypothetical protein
MMQNQQQPWVVYCPDITCGTNERRNDVGPSNGRPGNERRNSSDAAQTVITSQSYRQMEYRGNERTGFFEVTIHHYFECPVCGREVTYIEKNGVRRRVP